jgi:hypothetical protein
MPSRICIAILAFACLIGFGATDAGAGQIAGQRACRLPGADYCVLLGYGQSDATIRELTFRPKITGTAAVTFSGTAVCFIIRNGGLIQDRTALFLAQIVVDDEVVSFDTGASYFYTVLKDSSVNSATSSNTFNLGMTRTFRVKAGVPRTFKYKLTGMTLSEGAFCPVYNATFTVVVP